MQGIVRKGSFFFWTLKSVCEVHNPFLVEKIPCRRVGDRGDLSVSLHRGREGATPRKETTTNRLRVSGTEENISTALSEHLVLMIGVSTSMP